jgi:iron complex transport system permease protein
VRRRLPAVYVGAFAALMLAVVISVSTGAAGLPLRTTLAALLGRHRQGPIEVIVWQIRVPRTMAAALVGAGLAIAGAVLQSLLRNPLAEPFTLGVASGAGFAVSGVAAFAPSLLLHSYAGPLAGFGGAMFAGAIVFALAHRQGFSETAMALCGVILSFFFGALIMINYSVGRPEGVQSAMLWMMGDLSTAESSRTIIAAAVLLVPLAYVVWAAPTLDALSLGEERAAALGVPTGLARRLLFAAAALITGVCVATAGVIGFVGLLIPHLVRYMAGGRSIHVLPLSGLFGGAFLILADVLGRSIFPPLELPVGVFTGIAGTLFFLLYYWRRAPEELR